MHNFRWYSAYPQTPVASSFLSRVFRAVLGLVLVFAALFVSAVLVVAMMLKVLFRSGGAARNGPWAGGGPHSDPGAHATGRRVWAPPSQASGAEVVDIESREVRSPDADRR